MPAGINAPEPVMKIVVLSPSMSSQMRCDSANCRPPKPVPSIFSSRPATDRSRSTWTGRVGIVRYLLGFGFRCVTIDSVFLLFRAANVAGRAVVRLYRYDIWTCRTQLIMTPPTLGLVTVNCDIGVGVVTRFIKVNQLCAFGFGQF